MHVALAGTTVLIGGLVLAHVLSAAPQSGQITGGSGSGGADLGGTIVSFAISGHTQRPISPGVMVRLNLKLRNPNGFSLTASRIKVTVRAVSAPRATHSLPCTLDDFAVQQAPGSLQVELGDHKGTSLRRLDLAKDMWPRVGMLNTSADQDGCKKASLTLAYTAFGTTSH